MSRGSCTPISRSTGSREHLVTRCPGGTRRTYSPGERRCSQTSRAHIESESARTSSNRFEAIRRMDEESCSRTSWSSTTSFRDDLNDLWNRRRGVEPDVRPPRGPRAEERCLRPGQRTSDRLAADARRRRARGRRSVPTEQRRERTLASDRATSARRDCAVYVRQRRRHRPRRVRLGLPSDPRLDARRLRLSPANITGFEPLRSSSDRLTHCARELGVRARRSRFAVVTVGGSASGVVLLRRVVAAFPEAKARVRRVADGRRRGAADRRRTLPTFEGPRHRTRYVPDLLSGS